MADLGVQIIKLREQGYSYNQIKEALNCSKGTISYHLSDQGKEKAMQRQRDRRMGIEPERAIKEKPICGYRLCSNPCTSPGAKFCSRTCPGKEKIQSWLAGEWSGNSTEGLTSLVSDYVKELAGWRCQSEDCCVPGGWSQVHSVTGRVPVQIDHIDGNSMNSKIENLIVLCPNCHSLTETYGNLNKNSARTWRKKNVSAIG